MSFDLLAFTTILAFSQPDYDVKICDLSVVQCQNEITVTVTAYNTLESQTDGSPCMSASGDNICGRKDVVACPKKYHFHTKFEIDGKIYECLDRTASKYGNRIDISFDKDLEGAIKFGKQVKKVMVVDNPY